MRVVCRSTLVGLSAILAMAGRTRADGEIGDLVRWVEMGVPHGEKIDVPAVGPHAAETATFWAFQPVVRPALPTVKNSAWLRTPIDRFILAELEAKGLSPAPPADKRTLIRRATYDLTGLPPTPDEIAAFLADDSPAAFAGVVDHLLASPRYGERWGRHWLDIARYADSNGLDENICHGNAWRYRDYVIGSLNADKPYDQFIREQIAGDLLPSADAADHNENLIATGFLALGPKVLAEVDERKMEMDIIDEQIDTIGKSLLGLTLGCARCHDHKFDPISTRDYYALAGIFKSTRTMEHFTKIARWNENTLVDPAYEAKKAEHDARLAAKKRELDGALAEAKTRFHAADQQDLGGGAAAPEEFEAELPHQTRDELKAIRDAVAALEKATPVAPSAMGVGEREVVDVPVHLRGSHLTLGEVVPRGFPKVLSSGATPTLSPRQSGRLELAWWITDGRHPLTARVMVNRVWRWHFGRGLVATTDNFGRLGERPSHPELLDWLADQFVASGWSLKQLHREIMLSATYQQSSSVVSGPWSVVKKDRATDNGQLTTDTPHSALRIPHLVDPENRLLWRANMRRLDADELRDAMLAVGGQLDETMGGTLLALENRAFFFDHTSKDETSYDSRRRSVYLPVVRNHLADSFTLFDYSDAAVPTGDRPTSTVAPQALYLLNSDFAATSAEAFARRVLQMPLADDHERVGAAFASAYGRPPLEGECASAVQFLDYCASELPKGGAESLADAQRLECWRLFCQTLLMSNEFLYVE